ncbi:hypothetical protein MHY87_08520 [Microvirga sp. ACRRW]|uniref:hypothetical protein n=1 Tax=Microvirga sp. ACRRW TaxID=2918205 RepID=UPI001EF70A4B|nr:hypothetical protein [Microvirga sp. ACRRW]MCG7392945.1 hypothetical protein [Microvirga sp. ACRRW]
MFTLRNLIVGVAATAAVSVFSFFLPCSAIADDEGAVFGEVTVSNIAATPARVGETTIITFSIENTGSDGILITGLQLPGGEPSKVMGAFGQGQRGEIGTLPVQAGATEHLDGTKVWIEVGPLAQDLHPDTTAPALLVLGSYESPLTLHVGPVATGSIRSTGLGPTKIADHAPAPHGSRSRC